MSVDVQDEKTEVFENLQQSARASKLLPQIWEYFAH
jgi:hypothetical protein